MIAKSVCLVPRSHRNAGLQTLLHAHAVREDDPQTRDAKWARGSRSQTHRRAGKGGFTQGDVKVRRSRPDRTLLFLSVLKSCVASRVLKLTLIPIPGPVQHRLSRCLE